MQHPIVGAAILVEESEGALETLRAREIRFSDHLLAVDLVLAALEIAGRVVVMVGVFFLEALDRRLHHRDPGIVLLPAHELPGVVAVVIGGAAILEIMEMVADQMAVDTGLLQNFRQGIIERLQRPPRAMHEIEPTGMDVPPCRHAGQRADIVIVEADGATCETIEIRRRDLCSAVTAQGETIERIEKHEHGAHGRPSPDGSFLAASSNLGNSFTDR